MKYLADFKSYKELRAFASKNWSAKKLKIYGKHVLKIIILFVNSL